MKSSFQNMISEHDIAIATSNFGLTLNALWKRALQIALREYI